MVLDGGLGGGGGGGPMSLCAAFFGGGVLEAAAMESWPLCPLRWCRRRLRAGATANLMSDTVSVSAFVLESWPLAEEVVVVASVVVRALTAMASCPRFLLESGRPSECPRLTSVRGVASTASWRVV